MNAKENRNKIFETNSINKNIILYLFIVITFLLKFEILIESFKNNIRYIIYNNIILGLTEI